jgi:PTH1 family peptidyl-tRNA hydrolase
VGFETINKLAYDHNINISKAKFRGHFGEGALRGQRVLLLKPQTYMNLSGECVRDVLSYYKLTPEALIVVYDDTSIDPGEIRVRKRGSAGGHNGMKNIIYQLETDEFVRIRIGIGEKPPGWDLAAYVLSRISKAEQEAIITGITKASEAVETILKEGVAAAMNTYNTKKAASRCPGEEPGQRETPGKNRGANQ